MKPSVISRRISDAAGPTSACAERLPEGFRDPATVAYLAAHSLTYGIPDKHRRQQLVEVAYRHANSWERLTKRTHRGAAYENILTKVRRAAKGTSSDYAGTIDLIAEGLAAQTKDRPSALSRILRPGQTAADLYSGMHSILLAPSLPPNAKLILIDRSPIVADILRATRTRIPCAVQIDVACTSVSEFRPSEPIHLIRYKNGHVYDRDAGKHLVRLAESIPVGGSILIEAATETRGYAMEAVAHLERFAAPLAQLGFDATTGFTTYHCSPRDSARFRLPRMPIRSLRLIRAEPTVRGRILRKQHISERLSSLTSWSLRDKLGRWF